MQAMQRAAAAVGPRALSGATALVFAGGFALYQMTSLVLGPPATRQLQLSLSLPVLEPNDRVEPADSSTTIVLGILAPAARVGSPDGRTANPGVRNAAHANPAPTPAAVPTAAATVAPVPTPEPRRSDHGRSPVVPTPPAPRDHEPD
jgi:hypothetical protein